jgi:hypothetical protein
MEIIFKNWEHILATLGAVSIFFHALEAGCTVAGWTKYQGIFSSIYKFIQGFLGNMKPPVASVIFILVFFATMHVQAQTTTTPTDFISEIVSTIKPSEGIMYGVREHQVKDVTSFQIIGYQDAKYELLALDGNFLYSPSNLIGGSITYPIGNFSSITGVATTIPILSWLGQMNINVGYGFGWFVNNGSGTRANDSGPVMTGTIKF